MINKHLLLFVLILTFQNSFAGPWFQKCDFGGDARHRASSFTIGTKGYIGLGHINSGVDVEYEDFWQYDPASDAWSQIANYPLGRCFHAAQFVIGDIAYVGTGRLENGTYTKQFFAYDPQINTWSPIADLPGVARRGAVGFTVNGKGYVGTGQTTAGNSVDFYEYNPLTNTWLAKAPLPGSPRTSSVAFSIDSYGYVGTGQTDMGSANDFYEYNPASNTWTVKAFVGPITRQEATGFSLNGKGYIGTGDDYSSGNNYGDFWEYDRLANTWTPIEDFSGTARRYLTSFVIGSRAYVGTGTNGTNFKDFWMFDQILSVLGRKMKEIDVLVYPNPSADIIHINLGELPENVMPSAIQFEVYSLSGQLIKSIQCESSIIEMNISSFESGTYIYRLTHKGDVFHTNKLILAR